MKKNNAYTFVALAIPLAIAIMDENRVVGFIPYGQSGALDSLIDIDNQ